MTSRHTDALAAFEQYDPLAGLQAKISTFQRKQTKQAAVKDDKYNWIQTQRKLKEKEEMITKQIIQASSNLLELLQQHETAHPKEKENIDPVQLMSTCDAIKTTIQGVISALKSNPYYQEDDIISRILQLKQLSKDKPAQKVLSDLRAEIDTSLQETAEQFSALSKETAEHRRRVMLLLKKGQDDTSQIELPQSLSSALDSLRTLVGQDEDGGVIDSLENDLRRDMEDAHIVYKSTLRKINTQSEPQLWDENSRTIVKTALSSSSSSTSNKLLVKRLSRDLPDKSQQEIKEYLNYHTNKKLNKQKVEAAEQDYKRRCQLIETDGLKETERLRKDFTARSKKMESSIDNKLKQKVLQLKLKALRQHHEESERDKAEAQKQASSKQAEDEYNRDLERTQRLAKAKHTLRRYQTQQIADQEGTCNDNLQHALDSEKRKCTNRARVSYRKEQIISRQLKEREQNEQLVRKEEARIERLNSLAASVPYYDSIIDKAPDIHKTTKARDNDFYRRPKLQDFQSGNLKSFTMDKVFSDSKFKLASALHEAGLSSTTYARDVVRAAIPRNEAPI